MQDKSITFLALPYDNGMKTGRPPKSNRTDFAARLAALRTAAGLSQRQVAAALGISQPSYVLWEQHNVAITAEQLVKLTKTLNVRAEDLLYEDAPSGKGNGPCGKARRIFEEVSKLPRNRQQRILSVVEDWLAAQRVSIAAS
jgi:transcriptional regulator with XRE-family HTH domain